MSALLSVVATPIGNREDITLRALRVFREADLILCEDTRVAKKLLAYYEIKTPLLSYHQHSDNLKTEKIKELLKAGNKLALISDAGTPGVSDPGSKLISQLRETKDLDLKMEIIPGPSALTAALSLAGTGFDRFIFLGFLPHKKGRQTFISQIINSKMSFVLYESKHRLLKLLQELSRASELVGAKKELLIFREISKLHESVYKGEPDVLLTDLQKDANNLKGEFVVLIKDKNR
ncbi:MAG: rRNA (cytidine1402-2-O)-methyltransferase [Patescibacteria group bacterium]|nr:rRNA (cytidine1402-2-O)-methyltransferase [Patescibacteria group bacterium]